MEKPLTELDPEIAGIMVLEQFFGLLGMMLIFVFRDWKFKGNGSLFC